MPMIVEATALRDAYVVRPTAIEDSRGFFSEAFRADWFQPLGLNQPIVQVNHSGSVRNVTRGLHFQWDPPLAKVMRVIRGEAFLVAVDIRKGSPTLGKSVTLVASADNRAQLYAPAGFARGFSVTSDFAEIEYLTTGLWNRAGEGGIQWNDPALDIAWPVSEPILSPKDAAAESLASWLARPESDQFVY